MKIKLNQTELRSAFYGTILGDSSLSITGLYSCKNINKDLLDFKYNLFKSNFNPKLINYKIIPENTDKLGVHRQTCYSIWTKNIEYFKKMYSKLYNENKKPIITEDVIKHLTPLGFALWFADDGTTILVGKNEETKSARSRRIQICTDAYSYTDIINLQKWLLKYHGYEVKIVKRDKNSYRIEFINNSRFKFIYDISSYFIKYFPSLLYKLDLGYRNESLENRRYVTKEYQDLYIKMSANPLFIDRMKNR